jgi:hypothetical protein
MVQDGPSSGQQLYIAPLVQLAAAETCKHIGTALAEPELAKAVQGGVIDSILECVDGSGEASGVDRLSGFCNAWLHEAFLVSQHCSNFDGRAYKAKQQDAQRFLATASSKSMIVYASLNLKSKIQIDGSIDVFASEKAKTINAIVAAMDNEHRGELEAIVCLDDPAQAIMSRLVGKRRHDAQTARAVAFAAADSRSSAAMVAAQDLQRGHAELATLAVNKTGGFKVVSKPRVLKNWFESIVQSERVAKPDEPHPSSTAYLKKIVMAAVSHEISNLNDSGYDSAHNSALCSKDECVKDGSQVKSTIEVTRIGSRVETETGPPVVFELPYWGRVVDCAVAANMSRATLLPLPNLSGDGPDLFLDGSANMNTKRSDCCMAWLVKPMPLQPQTKAQVSEPIVDGGGDDEETSLVVSCSSADPPPTKRARLRAKVAAKPLEKKDMSGESYDVVATHMIRFEPMPVFIKFGDGTDIVLEYARPVLIDCPNTADVCDQPCYRELIEWDTPLVKTEIRKPKLAKKGFVLK